MEAEEMRHVEQLLPSIKKITDADIRHKVGRAWLQMWHRGSYRQIEDCSWFEVMRNDISWSNHEHTEEVARIAVAVAKTVSETQGIRINLDHVIAGALMHDLDKLVTFDGETHEITTEGSCLPHGFYSAKAALDVGLPIEIAHICASHAADSPSKPRTAEAVIVHFADLLSGNLKMVSEGQPFIRGSLMSSYVTGIKARRTGSGSMGSSTR